MASKYSLKYFLIILGAAAVFIAILIAVSLEKFNGQEQDRTKDHTRVGEDANSFAEHSSEVPQAEESTRIAAANRPHESNTENSDETEFLVFNYRRMRSSVDRSNSINSLVELRDKSNRYREYIKARKMNSEIESLYSDMLSAINLTSDYLRCLDEIDRKVLLTARRESRETAVKSGFTGGMTGAEAYGNGSSGLDAVVTGLTAAAITGFFENIAKQEDLDDSKRQAIETASENFQRKLSVVKAHEANTLSDLAVKYHWQKDNNGLSLDHFTKLETELGHQYLGAFTPEEAMRIANKIENAAQLIPTATIYDEYRGYAFHYAARLATWAAEVKSDRKQWGSLHLTEAEKAIALWDLSLHYGPDDASGEIRSGRAWALAIAGHFDDAIAQANQVADIRKNSPPFIYNYVRLFSCAGKQYDETITNLSSVLAAGDFASDFDSMRQIDLGRIRSDSNLENLRVARPKQFNDLFQVKYVWDIKFGWFKDDIVLTNQSCFPISNVVLNVQLVQDEKNWTLELKANRIVSGETYKWENVVHIPGGRLTSESATMTCDEGR